MNNTYRESYEEIVGTIARWYFEDYEREVLRKIRKLRLADKCKHISSAVRGFSAPARPSHPP